tara:strand:- start:446 stop:1081 length:636 start_codon:yes stop_codon:yes gene_type:complete
MKLGLIKTNKNHCKIFFEIRNEYSTRVFSKNKEKLNYAIHKKWFLENFNSKGNLYYLGKAKDIPFGYIRYEKRDFYFEVSIAIKKKFRNLGLSKFLMEESEKLLKKPNLIISHVKNLNKRSINMFIKNNYTIISKNKNTTTFGKLTLINNFNKQKKIINKIKSIRSKNNVNWMNILELAFEKSPIKARNIFKNISKDDNNIVQLSKKLSKL